MNSRFLKLCRVYCKKANFSGVDYLGTAFKFRKRKKIVVLFTSSIKREIRYFHVVVVQGRQRNVQRSVMHVHSCCFAQQTYCFFDVLVTVSLPSPSSLLKLPKFGSLWQRAYPRSPKPLQE